MAETYGVIYWKDKTTTIDGNIYDTLACATKKDAMLSASISASFKPDNLTSKLNNISNMIYSKKADELTNRRSFTALNQFINTGKMTSQEALNNIEGLCKNEFAAYANKQGIPLDSLISLLQTGGVDKDDFISQFEQDLQRFNEYNQATNNTKANTANGILIDFIFDDTRNYTSELPERRVQSGKSYTDFVNNRPLDISITGHVVDGRFRSLQEFESIINQIRFSKLPFKLLLGDDTFENCLFSDFIPVRNTENGDNSFSFTATIKQIDIQDIQFVDITITAPSPRKTSKGKSRVQKANKKINKKVASNNPTTYAGKIKPLGTVESVLQFLTGAEFAGLK